MPPALFARLPAPALSVRVEIAHHGGHVGFVEGRQGRLASWLARRVGQQLDDWQSTTAAIRAALDHGEP